MYRIIIKSPYTHASMGTNNSIDEYLQARRGSKGEVYSRTRSESHDFFGLF